MPTVLPSGTPSVTGGSPTRRDADIGGSGPSRSERGVGSGGPLLT
ncbi:MAG: hypothetical protein ABSD03_09400 [Vulcanimicrobiaceae bacterium]